MGGPPPVAVRTSRSQPWYKQWWVVVGAAVLTLLLAAVLVGGDPAGQSPTASSTARADDSTGTPDPADRTLPGEQAYQEWKDGQEEASRSRAAESRPSEEVIEPEPEAEPEPEPEVAPDLTTGQQNAREAAVNYLEFSAFSRTGLIEQLEYEGYSTADATSAVDALSVNWREQAVKSAANYLEFSAFSRTGLIEQLEYEGFSTADATSAVDALGVDWREQAVKSAENYLSFSSFSRSGLVEQLVYEGFTPEQAEYGASQTYDG